MVASVAQRNYWQHEVCILAWDADTLRSLFLENDGFGELMRSKASALSVFLLLFGIASAAADLDAAYQQAYKKWQAGRDESLRKNWLTLVGLFWLKDGTNRVGGDHKDEVPLPEGKVAPQIGVVEFHSGKAVFTAASGAKITSDGKPVQTIELRSDVTDKPTILQLGDLKMLLIQRGHKYGIRIRDSNSSGLKEFKGLEYYPLSGDYLVTAKFIPDDKPRKVAIPTVLGEDAEIDSVGYVEFTLNGQKLRLHALSEGDDELFFIIKDQTAGQGTYPAGRFLYSALPKDGKIVLDFNRAENPPCAFTPYATCPLPPKENYMPVKVEAGEKYQGHH
jgi:uncharacterized protein (DUF1684 family)